MTEPQTSSSRPADASRRLYVWWGIALALLLALGVFCWLFVLPVLQVRALLQDPAHRPATTGWWGDLSRGLLRDRGKAPESRVGPEAVESLGGAAAAARKLSVYYRAPERAAPFKADAVVLLGYCGRHGVPTLARALRDCYSKAPRPRSSVALWAAMALGQIGPDAWTAVPELEKALLDSDMTVSSAAREALIRITGRPPDIGLPIMGPLPEIEIRRDEGPLE